MRIQTIIRALDDVTRMRMLRLLAGMELSVGELCHILGQSQPRVSRHVGILCDADLVERRREGSSTFLREMVSERSEDQLEIAVAELLRAAEEADPEFSASCAEDRRRLAEIRTSRELAAADYFARHAEEWSIFDAAFAPPAEVEAALRKSLEGRPPGAVLDVGTGTGRIAELLAADSNRVVALDKSPEMLRLARARLQNLPLWDWELLQGDFSALPFKEESFDTVIFHHVLRYARDPLAPLLEAARVCRSGGMVLITDCANDAADELRRLFSEARPGFGDQEMATLLKASDFEPREPLEIPGKKVTTKIWTGIRGTERMTTAVRAPRLSDRSHP